LTEKNEKELLQRYQIIHKNFFSYLSKKGISFKKYAEENNVDRSMSSKWKKGTNKMTVDQIYQAAKYFDITVNDLFYTEKEKEKLKVISSGKYDPILAKKTVNIKLYDELFENIKAIFLIAAVTFLILGITAYQLLKSNNSYWILGVLAGIILVRVFVKSSYIRENTYIINYLDYIYYLRKDTKNKHFRIQLALTLTTLISFFPFIFMISRMQSMVSVDNNIVTSITIVFVIYLCSKIFSLVFAERKMEAEISDEQIQAYWVSFLSLMFALSLMTMSIVVTIFNAHVYWGAMVFSGILLTIQSIDFILTSNNFSLYNVVFEEDEKAPRSLFPKKNE